jgi:hypothetical protein
MQVREVRHKRGASLASRDLLIQRKSINNFSTSWLARVFALVIALFTSGCGGGSAPQQPETLSLAPLETTIGLSPNQVRDVGFRLSSGGVPVGGRTVLFNLTKAAGGTASSEMLLDKQADTDSKGVARVRMKAGGAAHLILEARSGNATAAVEVIVIEGASATVIVEPFFAPASEALPQVTKIDVLFFDDKACRDLMPASPAAPTRPTVTLTRTEPTARFDYVSAKGLYAVVGRALAHERTVAAGCVDLPGAGLAPGGVMELGLPLNDVIPDPVGSYAVSIELSFLPTLADAAAVTAAYAKLADCPFDPAELLLDCTIDALSPPTSDDPLDCLPANDPAKEGPVAAKLALHRGLPIVDGAGVPTGCRGPRDADGGVSFDAVVLGLYGSPKPALLVSLPAIANDAAHLFDHITLSSTLEVKPESALGSYSITHTLMTAAFYNTPFSIVMPDGTHQVSAKAVPSLIGIAGYPVPIPTAYSRGMTVEDQLFVAEQGFTLRLGTLARAAFISLVERYGSSGGATGLMTTLTGLARSPDGAYRGCAAIDHALCERIGEAPGCLVNACGTGMTAFADILDAAFKAVDGAGLDLYLSGTATLHDSHRDGMAGRIGVLPEDETTADAWRVELHTSADRRIISAPFVGVR